MTNEKITYENLSPELQNILDGFLVLQKEVEKLKIKKVKKDKKEFSDLIKLTEMKQEFIASNPRERTDPFTDWELVFWASYILSTTSRREKLDNLAEVAKRGYTIKKLVEFYSLEYKTPDKKLADIWARIKVKNYLEYVLTTNETLPTKNGKVPFTFWIAVSDWSVTQFSTRVDSWIQTNKIKDEPPE